MIYINVATNCMFYASCDKSLTALSYYELVGLGETRGREHLLCLVCFGEAQIAATRQGTGGPIHLMLSVAIESRQLIMHPCSNLHRARIAIVQQPPAYRQGYSTISYCTANPCNPSTTNCYTDNVEHGDNNHEMEVKDVDSLAAIG